MSLKCKGSAVEEAFPWIFFGFAFGRVSDSSQLFQLFFVIDCSAANVLFRWNFESIRRPPLALSNFPSVYVKNRMSSLTYLQSAWGMEMLFLGSITPNVTNCGWLPFNSILIFSSASKINSKMRFSSSWSPRGDCGDQEISFRMMSSKVKLLRLRMGKKNINTVTNSSPAARWKEYFTLSHLRIRSLQLANFPLRTQHSGPRVRANVLLHSKGVPDDNYFIQRGGRFHWISFHGIYFPPASDVAFKLRSGVGSLRFIRRF